MYFIQPDCRTHDLLKTKIVLVIIFNDICQVLEQFTILFMTVV